MKLVAYSTVSSEVYKTEKKSLINYDNRMVARYF